MAQPPCQCIHLEVTGIVTFEGHPTLTRLTETAPRLTSASTRGFAPKEERRRFPLAPLELHHVLRAIEPLYLAQSDAIASGRSVRGAALDLNEHNIEEIAAI
jgi:hypothetical protein